jgi:shikimate 5-dehydrogenase
VYKKPDDFEKLDLSEPFFRPLTPFLNSAKSNNLKTIDGFNMLIFQAKKSFEIWNCIKIT